MARITFSTDDELAEKIEERVENGDENKSEVVRSLIKSGLDAEEEIGEHEQKVERLRNEKRQLIEDREEKQELVEYVEKEKETAEAEREIRTKPAWSRAKIWLLGRNGERQD